MVNVSKLPSLLYSSQKTRQLDQIAIDKFGLPGYTLMNRAGSAVFSHLQQKFPLAKRILVCCGAGNNAGDGYVIARLAHKAGYEVEVLSLVDPKQLKGDARTAYDDWKSLGFQLTVMKPELFKVSDVIVDALLGTGLERPVEGQWQTLIEQINQSHCPVVAVDIPSGLEADTGRVLGVAVKATLTVSFIALKKGMLTYQALDYCGEIYFDNLDVPEASYRQIQADACLLQWSELRQHFKPRLHDSHKSNYGHVLVIGGDYGMPGAVRMAAEAALRSGAGLVTVVTRPEHVNSIVTARPELMVFGTEDGRIPDELLARVSSIVIGPGLGRHSWGNRLLGQVLATDTAKVIDADALNLLAIEDGPRTDWVLTPHPGEAARLLGDTPQAIQSDRFMAVEMLQQSYGGCTVLKGSGTLVKGGETVITAICAYGNPGMASAGMGDVLSGVIGALLAQGFGLEMAAKLAVVVHARAADQAAAKGQRGLLATDLFDSIRDCVNPDIQSESH